MARIPRLSRLVPLLCLALFAANGAAEDGLSQKRPPKAEKDAKAKRPAPARQPLLIEMFTSQG